jgi:hypothetical protein
MASAERLGLYSRERNADCDRGNKAVPNERGADGAAEDVFSGTAEDWEPWESVLVLLSIALGTGGLVLLGWLVDRYILH